MYSEKRVNRNRNLFSVSDFAFDLFSAALTLHCITALQKLTKYPKQKAVRHETNSFHAGQTVYQSTILNIIPSAVLSALIVPPCASAVAFAIERPIPVPPVDFERELSGR